ncbi:hypothetical protein R1sor_003831 [Riccia sorocarpa]|uniref:Uncharacterized protein n=1 Tax=Riccia sorocarpa TaxID=122646 RepID=A0ABD3H6P5_9MARC
MKPRELKIYSGFQFSDQDCGHKKDGKNFVDVLDFYKNSSIDVQESLVLALSKHSSGYNYWTYDIATSTIFVDCLLDLRLACDAEEERRSIWLAILTGLPKKLVVETHYSCGFESSNGTRIRVEEELDDPMIKEWMLQVVPDHERVKGFPVDFVFNPWV